MSEMAMFHQLRSGSLESMLLAVSPQDSEQTAEHTKRAESAVCESREHNKNAHDPKRSHKNCGEMRGKEEEKQRSNEEYRPPADENPCELAVREHGLDSTAPTFD
jgi:hypothetical protein